MPAALVQYEYLFMPNKKDDFFSLNHLKLLNFDFEEHAKSFTDNLRLFEDTKKVLKMIMLLSWF